MIFFISTKEQRKKSIIINLLNFKSVFENKKFVIILIKASCKMVMHKCILKGCFALNGCVAQKYSGWPAF